MAYGDNFKVFGPYKRKDGRQIVVVEDKKGKRRTISYPKWLMELSLGRELDPDLETVDHKDSDFDNNNLDNLELVERTEHSTMDTRRVKPVECECAWCGKKFERSPRLLRQRVNKMGPFCSKSCAGKASRQVQLGLIDNLPKQQHIDSEYYKQKYASKQLQITFDLFIDLFCDYD